MIRLSLIGAIAIGGALGAVARFGTALALASIAPQSMVAGTLAANCAGSFLIGLIAMWVIRRTPSPLITGFLVTGFCGGFTTFSVFSLETVLLAISGHWAGAGIYVLVSILSWLCAVWLGWRAGSLLFAPRAIES